MNGIISKETQSELVFANGFVDAVYADMDDIKHSFFRIGFRLTEAKELKYYKALGYANISDLALDKFGFSQSTTYELMQIYELAHSSASLIMSPMYDKYSQSQLRGLCRLKYRKEDFMQWVVKPSDKVTEINKAVSIWNKYLKENSQPPQVNSIVELFEFEKKEQTAAPLLELAEQNESRNDVEFSAYAENSELSGSDEANTQECETESNEIEECAQTEDNSAQPRSEAEIIKIGLTGVDIYAKDAKYMIYDRYLREPDRSKFAEYIKGVYNYSNKPDFTHGFYSLTDNMNRTYDEQGIQLISFDPYQRVRLTWIEVACEISGLIYTDEYLTAEELEHYPQWKAEQDGLVVNVTPIASSEDTKNSANAEKLNFKNEKERREWLDNFRAWGVWLEIPEVDKTFYRYNFVNGNALIIEVGFEYWAWSTKQGAQERVSYSIIDDKHPKFNSKGESYTDTLKWLTNHAKEI